MTQDLSVSDAILILLRAIGHQLKVAGWFKGSLWFLWLIFTAASFSAIWGSIREYESRAAWIYGGVFLVLLALGLWTFF